MNTSEEILSKIPINLDIYGFYNTAGVHQHEPEPVPNFYIPERDIHFYDSDWFIEEIEQHQIDKFNQDFEKSCKSVLPTPQNLTEIIQLGIDDWRLGMCALAEVFEQLYNQTQVDVLVLMDDYNWCFRPSKHKSFRYSSLKRLNNSIPPEHMALLRLFMKFDGHKIRRGFKVYGNSNRTISRHYFSPDKINFNESHAFALKGMTSLKEIYNFKVMSMFANAYRDNETGLGHSMQFLMESQGNFKEMLHLMGYSALKEFDTRFIGRKKKNKTKRIRDLKKIYNTIQ